jgi:hypothetical protein
MAQRLLDRPDARTAGLWPRAAALLARQALEQALDEYWRSRQLPLDQLPTRPQLICLREYLHDDAGLAGSVNHAWNALSQACHHHPYELAPSLTDLQRHMLVVADLISVATP